jgi:hypothetical protein
LEKPTVSWKPITTARISGHIVKMAKVTKNGARKR